MDRYEEMLSRYKTDLDDAQVAAAVEKIVRDNLATNSTPDVYKFLFSCIDLTSLHTEDNTDSITKFTKRVNDFEEEHPEMPSVAAMPPRIPACFCPTKVAVFTAMMPGVHWPMAK